MGQGILCLQPSRPARFNSRSAERDLRRSNAELAQMNTDLDNFVYTEESFREAKAHLKPDGIIFVKFEVRRPWMARLPRTASQRCAHGSPR